uniref:HP1D2 n=1 Tax=Drosophila lutescens TaxID=51159 RepID=A0A142I119_DROLT|nr:HP1D2 [Drosophila lutescens]
MYSGQPEKPSDPTTSASANEPDSNVYVVEKIVGKRLMHGRLQYRVKWLGFSEEESTWEPLEGVVHCCDLLANFEAELLRRSQAKEKPAPKKPRKSTKKTKRRHSSSVSREFEQPSGQKAEAENELQAVINPSARRKRKLKSPIPRRHSSYLESSNQEINTDRDPIELELERIHSSPVDMLELPPQDGDQEDMIPIGELRRRWKELVALEASPETWRMPELKEPFGMERDLDLEKVHDCFKVRDQTFMMVTWKGYDNMEAVLLEEIRQAYPIPIIKFFESIRLSP